MRSVTHSRRSSDGPLLVYAFVFAATSWAAAHAQDRPSKPSALQVAFPVELLAEAPKVTAADGIASEIEGIESFFFEGLPYHGKPTRVFAYYGRPAEGHPHVEAGKKLPGIVLIHGGGGTAFDRWVKVWNDRGYAAIAMDLCGCVPVGTYGKWQRHEEGGPPGWDASFEQLDDAVEDQWTYHAVCAVMRAHSLIRAKPEVDAERIGVTGISWGGYMTCVVAGVDSRFKFAVPVYGCGFLGENSVWLPAFEKLGDSQAGTWLRQWDPAGYLPHAKMPILWVNGTNDFAYPMDSWRKSYRLPPGQRTLCLRVRMPHGHGPAGENPEEIHVFANAILRGGKPLAQITHEGQDGDQLTASFAADVPIRKAELEFTRDDGKWQDRTWETLEATLDANQRRVTARIPSDATAYYLNLFDERDCVVSTEHRTRE